MEVGLLHILPAHSDIGGGYYGPRRLLCQKAVIRDRFFALHPAGNAHGVLLNLLGGDQMIAPAFPQPFPGLFEDRLGAGDAPVLLLLPKILLDRRHFRAVQIDSFVSEVNHGQLPAAGVSAGELFTYRFGLSAGTGAGTASIRSVF